MTGCFDGKVCPYPIRQVHDLFQEVFVLRIQDMVGPHCLQQLAALGNRLNPYHRRAHASGGSHGAGSDVTPSEDDDFLPSICAPQDIDGIVTDSKRLYQGTILPAHVIGQLVQQAGLNFEIFGGRAVLGKAKVVGVGAVIGGP